MRANLSVPREQLEAFCLRHGIRQLAIFGSALRDDFGPDSDVDVLVEFKPEARPSLFDMVRMADELSELFDRRVELVSRRGIEASRNAIRREAILESAEVIYAA